MAVTMEECCRKGNLRVKGPGANVGTCSSINALSKTVTCEFANISTYCYGRVLIFADGVSTVTGS